KNPYGATFDKLSTPEKIRMVMESPKTSELSRDERRNLLGFLYNQKGVEEANAKNFNEAEKSLKTAIDYMGEHGRVVSNLAFVTAVQGNNLALAGDLREGEKQLEFALKLLDKTENPELKKQVNSALSGVYTKMGLDLPSTDRGRKENYFRKALEYDPTQHVALFELGQIAYANYELEKALDFYEAAYRYSGEPTLATLIQKVRTEFEEAGDFTTHDRGDFKISFEGRETKAAADKARGLLADAQRDVGRMVGLRPNDTIPVVIYSAGQFQNILGLHSWAGAAYDGKIRLPIADLSERELKEGEDRIRQIVYHEYTHAVLQSHLGRKSVPIWFQEGVAQLASGETPRVGDPNWVVRGVSTGMIPIPSEMTGQFSTVRDGQMASALYFVSFSFMRYLIEEHGGWSRLRRLIDRLTDGDSMTEAFKSTYRRTLSEIEEDWLLALERRDPSAF
ncbi:MAG: hypothetical protein KC931_15995, partial [Candidatus Omnitrophica bacterium]|nr:hypothetical protein [Candidatus Omnitrophota bacterium]